MHGFKFMLPCLAFFVWMIASGSAVNTYGYSYDAAGNLATRIDALGHVTQYTHNVYDEISQITYPTNPAVSFQYDALGRPTSMTDGSGTTTWGWDSASRNNTYGQSAIGQGLAYSYDAESHREIGDRHAAALNSAYGLPSCKSVPVPNGINLRRFWDAERDIFPGGR